MSRARVRQALADDAQAIAAVHVEAWRETYTNLLPAERLQAVSVEQRARHWRQTMDARESESGTGVFVAEDESGGIVAFGCCSRQRYAELAAKGFDGEFQAVYVLHAFQGRGWGRKLMAAMARHLTDRSLFGGSCWVLRENDRAVRFYEALGGERVAERAEELASDRRLLVVAFGWQSLNSIASI
jgi:ribosomal protein S18 acetylase RimI-like enzyme